MKTLIDFVPETSAALSMQLEADFNRWGDTWRHRPQKGQEERVFARIQDYFDQFRHAKIPIPWLKIIGECHIALVREDHPEELNLEE